MKEIRLVGVVSFSFVAGLISLYLEQLAYMNYMNYFMNYYDCILYNK